MSLISYLFARNDIVSVGVSPQDPLPVIGISGGTTAITVANGADVTQGEIADAAVTNPASSGSVIALLKGLLTLLGIGATYTNRSSTIAAGGTAQALMASNATRRGWRCQNLSSGKLFINDKGATAVATETGASFTLLPGQMYENHPNATSVGAISIIGATTSQAFEAAEW